MRRELLSFARPVGACVALVFAFAALTGCGGPTSSATGAKPGDGKQIFADAGCGGCHTLSAAGSKGTTGPSLNTIDLDAAKVAAQVKDGGGGMPAFGTQLSSEQIAAVAQFVAANDGSQ
jgi:mono/diheme cytochrome c family protein